MLKRITGIVMIAACPVFWACAPVAPPDNDLSVADYGHEPDVHVLDTIQGIDLGGVADVLKPGELPADDVVVADADLDGQISGDSGGEVLENVLYELEPDLGQCDPGRVSQYQKKIVLDRINYIRSLHGLMPVEYNDDGDEITAACSLIIAANRKLSHNPEENQAEWICYSDEAQAGCSSSNIAVQWGREPDEWSSIDIVDGFLTDEGVDTVGHRRWLIDPWLANIAFGRVDKYENNTTGAAIKVINGTDQQDISASELGFVAYPFHDYPAGLYNDDVMMSLTVIADTGMKFYNQGNKEVLFDEAEISVIDPDGKSLAVRGVLMDGAWIGVPNNLRWFVDGVRSGVKYDVVVSNVTVNNVVTDYEWWFELN